MMSQRALNIVAFLTLILVFVNMFLLVGNQSLQRLVAERQQSIMRGLQMRAPAREVITAMADLALRTDDAQLKRLLADHGITVPVNPAPSARSAKDK